MSRAYVHVEPAIIEAFADPSARYTVRELASLAYPDKEIGKAQIDAVGRALRKLATPLGLHKCRVGKLRCRGWRHVWGR
jgi:hypothetical protein